MKLRQLAFTLLILLVISDFSLSSDYKKKRVKNSSSKKFLAYFKLCFLESRYIFNSNKIINKFMVNIYL